MDIEVEETSVLPGLLKVGDLGLDPVGGHELIILLDERHLDEETLNKVQQILWRLALDDLLISKKP